MNHCHHRLPTPIEANVRWRKLRHRQRKHPHLYSTAPFPLPLPHPTFNPTPR